MDNMDFRADYSDTDPTSFSYSEPPEWQVAYEKSESDPREIHFSHLCTGILNVCQLVRDVRWSIWSVSLDGEKIQEKLTFPEILADLSLIGVLSSDNDRDILLGDDLRNLHWENISPHNCRIFSSGSYSVFDIACVELRSIPRERVLGLLYESIQNLYGSPLDVRVPYDFFYQGDLLGQEFGERMLKNTFKFLERYDDPAWKQLFIRQRGHAEFPAKSLRNEIHRQYQNAEDVWYQQDEKDYISFIETLKNVHSVFLWNPLALNNYIVTFEVGLREIRWHFDALEDYMGAPWANLRQIRWYFSWLVKSVFRAFGGKRPRKWNPRNYGS